VFRVLARNIFTTKYSVSRTISKHSGKRLMRSIWILLQAKFHLVRA